LRLQPPSSGWRAPAEVARPSSAGRSCPPSLHSVERNQRQARAAPGLSTLRDAGGL
jgi:hypothetical protein